MANTFQLTWTNSPAFETFDSVLVESAVGEDVSWTFNQDSGTTDVSAWTIQFDVAPSDNRNPVFTILNAAITKSIGGTISFPTLKAKTETLPPRSYYWELIRTDSGSRKVLSFGNWKLIGSPSLFPGVTVPPTIIPTNKGGTGSDLSDDGPSVIVQLVLGANLTALPADLSNTVLFLRKDLTWQTPSGAGIGTVTSVSVVTANGVSGSVATATSTPAITISLGAITPTSVAATGNVTGTNLSGTNTGDQTNISGNAATVSVIDAGADTTCWLLFANSQTGNLSPATNANATFNAATGVVSLASPAFSGVPSAPTATVGTNTTQVATCAFVLANGGSGGVPTQITVANEATDTTCFPGFFTAATGDLGPKTNAALTFNSNTANLGCTTFTGALVGNASTATLATNATNSAITNDTTTNATMYPTWVTTTTGNLPQKVSSTKFTFNPSTGNVTATTFTGALVGNADTATLAGTVSTNANLTGDVTSVGNATTLTNAPVIAKVLTGYASGAGTVAATDSILQAIQKLNGNDATNANLTGPVTSVGNATSIASQTGTGTTFAMSAGPTFTGVPAAPTASPGTNTTQLATTAFVAAAVTAGIPTAITVANEASDTTCFPLFATAATGDLGPKSNASLTFNSSTANLGCTTFTGALVGNATTATALANVRTIGGSNFDGSGNVTSFPTPGAIGGSTPAAGTFTALTGTSGSITGLTALAIRDTSAAFDLTIAGTSSTAFTAGRTLTLDLVNAARTLKISGNPTIADWFDQSVKTGASPTFVTVTAALTGNATTATTLATSRNLWGQAFIGAADVTGSLTSVADITGGASSMTITAGTGASRTLVFKTTTSGSTATTALTLAADQSATFANTVNATTFVGALTGNASTASAVAVGGITGLGTGVATALAINVGSAGAFVTFNGAGGTPSSITLTNGTALPIAGLTASTSTAIGVGSIELGHATNTTISQSAAGKIAVEGKAVPLMNSSVDAIFAGPTATRTYTLPDADTTLGAASTGANPSASVGLAAVNGSASTFLRSDGSPSLDQTAAWKFTQLDTTVFSPIARSSGSAAYLTVNAPADTALTASTEAIGVNFVGATRQHATGALTTQREYVFAAPTYSFVGASTITTAATLVIAAAPIAGTNATITNTFALWVQAGMSRLDGELGLLAGPISGIAVNINSSSLTRGFNCNISTGGTTNYGAQISVSGGATTNYGVYTSASGATNNNAIYISSNTTSGANNYAILSDATAISKFAADIQITTVGTGSTSAVTCGGTQTFTNKTMIASSNVVEEITSTASSATPTPTGGSLRNLYTLTALAAGATFAAPSGTPVDGNYLTIRVKDNGGAQTLAYNGIYAVVGVTAPLTTVAGKWLYLGCRYNGTSSKWHIISVAQEA